MMYPTNAASSPAIPDFPPGELRRYERGEYLYRPTDRVDTLFIVQQGVVKVGSYSAKGQEVAYDVLTPGELAGNLHYLPGNTFSEYARALTSVCVTTYAVGAFKQTVCHNNQWLEKFQQLMTRRWCRAETRLFHIASQSASQRVAHLLEQYAPSVQDAEGNFCFVRDLLTQQDIADLCGLTRQTTSRILKKLTL